MEKETLKSVMVALKDMVANEKEEIITLNFIAEFKHYNGDYKVLSVAKGKGKSGSLVMELISVTTGEKLNSLTRKNENPHLLGTPTSEYIVNITTAGVKHGFESESEMPRAFPRDKAAGKKLRETLKPFVNRTTETKLNIKSEKAPEFNGIWIVKNAKLHAGRGGQVSLALVNVDDPSQTRELWSYRHGAVIDLVEAV